MVERQDIDALLVGALYGELTPADEARLSAHLESHPADRTVLDGLKSARDAVRESRIFQVQIDPPQAVSALLLQEAARRAPKLVVRDREDRDDKPESWFARLARSFAAHPAVAAAATFVVVIGVAGTIYVRQGSGEIADQHVIEAESAVRAPSAPPVQLAQPPAGVVGATAASAQGSASTYQVALDDPETKPAQQASGKPRIASAPAAHRATTAEPTKPYVEVRTPERMPREMSESSTSKDDMDPGPQPTDRIRGVANAVTSPSSATGGEAKGASAGAGAAPSIPAPAMNVAKAAPSPATSEEYGWAPSQHRRVIELVANGKCEDAAPIAVEIRNRAPDYYNSYVATDRKLKSCMQYIAAAAKAAAKTAKANASTDTSK